MVRRFTTFAWVASSLLALGLGCAAQNKSASSTTKPYLLSTCIVSDEKFGGAMGDPVKYVYKGQEVRFCCAACQPEFDKDPEKFLKKLETASK